MSLSYSTISYKNSKLMINNFVYNFKEFESYMNHCINILKSINWLKDNQFKKEVSYYKYFKTYFSKFINDPSIMFSLYGTYEKEFLSKIKNKIFIKTNMYYLDGVESFHNTIKKIDDIGNINNSDKNYEDKFQQLGYEIILINEDLDLYKNFTEEEILSLALSGDIVILKPILINSDLTKDEIIELDKQGEIDFAYRAFNLGWLGGKGDFFDLFLSQNENERKIWYAKNTLFLQYLRKNQITFDLNDTTKRMNCAEAYNETLEHIEGLLKELERNFKKRKKTVPKQYSDFIYNIKRKMDNETNIFHNQNFSNDNNNSKKH